MMHRTFITFFFFFLLPIHCFPEKSCQVSWTTELSQFSSWLSIKGLWNIWYWILYWKTILIWKKHHHQILCCVFFGPILDVSLLKEKPCELACWFVLGFFQARINYGDLSAEVNKYLHLTFVECTASRREKSWQQSSLFTDKEFGKGVGSTSGVGWDSQTCLLFSPQQSQECHGEEGWCLPNPQHSPVFMLCLQRLLTTAGPLQLLLVALAYALTREAPVLTTGESCDNLTSRGFFQPRSLVSCFVLSVVLLIPFLQEGLEDAAVFTCGKWIILRVNFEKLVCAFGLKCKQGARHASPLLTGVFLRCELSPAHIGGLVGFIYGASIIPFLLGWFSEPLGRWPRSCNHGHCKKHVYVTFKKRGFSLGALFFGNYGEFCGGPLKPCHDKQTKGQQLSRVDWWNCIRKELGHPTSSVLSATLCQEWFGCVLPLF